MLGRTAGSLFWMFRYLERSENTARLIEAGYQLALTRNSGREDVWASIVATAGVEETFLASGLSYTSDHVVNFFLNNRDNPNSVLVVMERARDNALEARTALTREVWEAINQGWLNLKAKLSKKITTRELPSCLEMIRRESALVRGALHGTMLRNEIFDFTRLGCFVERFESTARILDVKYYVLLPSVSLVGSTMDNIQWEMILRSVSAHQSFRWLNHGMLRATSIADFIILDRRFPRSLKFSMGQIDKHLANLSEQTETIGESTKMASKIYSKLNQHNIDDVFAVGLHEYLADLIQRNSQLAAQIEVDYKFYR